jgi:hypothetical protein
MGIKIQDITSKSAKIVSTDLFEIAQVSGGTYVSRKVTGSEINELSLDTTPQLGGNLDVNSNKITSASNGNVVIEPNGSGAILIGGNSTQPTEMRFMEDSDNGTNYVALKASTTLAANTTYTLPTADGTSGQVLSTNASGVLSFRSFPIDIQLACSDETTALATGTAKITFRTPCAMTVTSVRASLTTAQTSGSIFTVDINEGGTSILSTKLTIDNTEKTSTTAATAPVISDSSLADDAEMTIDIDQIGDGTAKGLKITITGTRV